MIKRNGEMHQNNPDKRSPVTFFIFMLIFLVLSGNATANNSWHRKSAPKLLDLSGLVWIGGDFFLSVSDAKSPDEDRLNRVSVLRLPDSLKGLGYRSIRLKYPGGLSSDLESAAWIPGSRYALLVESSDDDGPDQSIFLARIGRRNIRIVDAIEWSSFTEVFNVEASAVAETDSGYIFLWAERNSGQQSTEIKWVDMTLKPFNIGGAVGSVEFALPADMINEAGNPLFSRAIVGMDIDSEGNIYTVAAFDPEGSVANPDNGPFRSAVFKVGQVIGGDVELDASPTVLAMTDGLKIESVTVRENGNGVELFFGTDDENFGGVLRQIPALNLP